MRGNYGNTHLSASVQQVFKVYTLTSHTEFRTLLLIVEHVDEHRLVQQKEIFCNSDTLLGGSLE